MTDYWLSTKQALLTGNLAVAPTDTIYGLLGRVADPNIIDLYRSIKTARDTKPYIILISHIDQLAEFGITLNPHQQKFLTTVWPGPVSVILECHLSPNQAHIPVTKLESKTTLAFRLPNKPELIDLINKSGPLFAPSCNPSGLTPASSIAEAKVYFKDNPNVVIPDFADVLIGSASSLIDLSVAPFQIIRATPEQLKTLQKLAERSSLD